MVRHLRAQENNAPDVSIFASLLSVSSQRVNAAQRLKFNRWTSIYQISPTKIIKGTSGYVWNSIFPCTLRIRIEGYFYPTTIF